MSNTTFNKACHTKQMVKLDIVEEERSSDKIHEAPTPVQLHVAKHLCAAKTMQEAPISITPAVADEFMHQAVPVFLAAGTLPGTPETPRGPAQQSRSTPCSGGTLDYVTPNREHAHSQERSVSHQQIPSFEGPHWTYSSLVGIGWKIRMGR